MLLSIRQISFFVLQENYSVVKLMMQNKNNIISIAEFQGLYLDCLYTHVKIFNSSSVCSTGIDIMRFALIFKTGDDSEKCSETV